jgi:hypothetical protein
MTRARKSPARAGLSKACHPEGLSPRDLPACYALKDFPQPQPPVDWGFVTENPAPRKSST